MRPTNLAFISNRKTNRKVIISNFSTLIYPTRFDIMIFLNIFSARLIWFVVVTFDFCHVSAWYGCAVVDTGLVGQWEGVGGEGTKDGQS